MGGLGSLFLEEGLVIRLEEIAWHGGTDGGWEILELWEVLEEGKVLEVKARYRSIGERFGGRLRPLGGRMENFEGELGVLERMLRFGGKWSFDRRKRSFYSRQCEWSWAICEVPVKVLVGSE